MPRDVELVVGTAQDSGLPVPLHAFARSLRFLEKVTLEIGLMLMGVRPELGPGELPALVHGACDLFIRELHASTPSAVLGLPPSPQPQLFEADGDLGERALAVLFDLTAAVVDDDRDRLPGILPVHAFRARILDSFKQMCPVAGEGLTVTIALPGTKVSHALDDSTRRTAQALSAYARPDEVVEWRSLVGRLVMLRSFPTAEFAVQRGRRALECPYDPEFEDKLLDLYGSAVRVNAACLIARHDDEEDEILGIQGIEDIDPIDESPLVITGIECGADLVVFAEPLRLSPTFDEDSILFEDPDLGLIGHGETREQAETAAKGNLCWLWETYARADDAGLAPDARRLRARLLRLTQGAVV